ncbi:MAG: Fic family protein [Caldilineaceae bacterium]
MFQPRYHISPQLLNTIKRITILIHELNQRHVAPVVLTELQREAIVTSTYASTSIEGNPLPLTEVRRILKNQPDHVRQSEQEVLNYNQILVALNDNPQIPFTADLLLHIHRAVTAKLLPSHQVGAWRQEPVVVYEPRTGGIVYLPPDHQEVESLIHELVDFVQDQRGILDPLLLAGIFHKQFVVIHPFIDGNGRTARLATKVLLAGLDLSLFTLLNFENYYNQNVTRYFQQVGLFGNYYDLVATVDFTAWLEYFAEGTLDELLRLDKSLATREATPATRLQPHHQLILDYIDQHGFITDRDYAQLTSRAKATRSLDFKKLIELGLLERQGRGRSIYYQRRASQ